MVSFPATYILCLHIQIKRSRRLEMMNADPCCGCFGVPLNKVIFVTDAVCSPTGRNTKRVLT